jgi:hypothetical protein
MSALTHNEKIRRARERSRRAEENCPHWDYDNPGGDDYSCCREMRAADEALRAATKATKDSTRETT